MATRPGKSAAHPPLRCTRAEPLACTSAPGGDEVARSGAGPADLLGNRFQVDGVDVCPQPASSGPHLPKAPVKPTVGVGPSSLDRLRWPLQRL